MTERKLEILAEIASLKNELDEINKEEWITSDIMPGTVVSVELNARVITQYKEYGVQYYITGMDNDPNKLISASFKSKQSLCDFLNRTHKFKKGHNRQSTTDKGE